MASKGFPTDAISLIFFLAELGVTLSEQDKEKIKAKILADKAEADALTDRSREQDAPMEGNA